jgi:hypothetical protein
MSLKLTKRQSNWISDCKTKKTPPILKKVHTIPINSVFIRQQQHDADRREIKKNFQNSETVIS